MHDPYQPPNATSQGAPAGLPLQASFRIGLADYLAAIRFNARPRPVYLALGGLVLAGFVFAALIGARQLMRGDGNLRQLAFLAVPVYLLAWNFWWVPRRARADYQRQLMWRDAFSAAFDERGFSIVHPAMRTRLPWGVVERWRESRSLFLVHQSGASFWIFPKRDLAAADARVLRELLRTAVGSEGRIHPARAKADDVATEYTPAPGGVQLRTPRLLLRDVSEQDIPTLVALHAEPSAQQAILGTQRDPDFIRRHFQAAVDYAKKLDAQQRLALHLVIVLPESGIVIGACSLSNLYPDSREAMLGWHLGEAHSGNGYTTEAALVLARHGFEARGVARLHADCFATNVRSRRIFGKLGMRQVGPAWLVALRLARKYREWRVVVRYRLDAAPDTKAPG